MRAGTPMVATAALLAASCASAGPFTGNRIAFITLSSAEIGVAAGAVTSGLACSGQPCGDGPFLLGGALGAAGAATLFSYAGPVRPGVWSWIGALAPLVVVPVTVWLLYGGEAPPSDLGEAPPPPSDPYQVVFASEDAAGNFAQLLAPSCVTVPARLRRLEQSAKEEQVPMAVAPRDPALATQTFFCRPHRLGPDRWVVTFLLERGAPASRPATQPE